MLIKIVCRPPPLLRIDLPLREPSSEPGTRAFADHNQNPAYDEVW